MDLLHDREEELWYDIIPCLAHYLGPKMSELFMSMQRMSDFLYDALWTCVLTRLRYLLMDFGIDSPQRNSCRYFIKD